MNIERLFRAAAFVCVVAIITLSVTPGTLRPQTGFSGYVEHLLVYVFLGLLVALGWTSKPQRITAVLLIVALGALLELLQLWIPGRTGDALSAIVSGGGGMIGVLLVLAYERKRGRVS